MKNVCKICKREQEVSFTQETWTCDNCKTSWKTNHPLRKFLLLLFDFIGFYTKRPILLVLTVILILFIFQPSCEESRPKSDKIEVAYYGKLWKGVKMESWGPHTPWEYSAILILEDGYMTISKTTRVSSGAKREVETKGRWKRIDESTIEISGLKGDYDPYEKTYEFERFNGRYKWDGTCLKRDVPKDEFCTDYDPYSEGMRLD
jgi:hypothetical protein